MPNTPERFVSLDTKKNSRDTALPLVSIVMPVFNNAEFTEKCLYSLVENTEDQPDYELVVVDNGSTDWTRYLLHAFEGDLRVLNNDENLGFGRACNQGAAICRSRYLVFLKNDTLLRPGWLQALVDLADSDPKIGVVGAKLIHPDSGKVQQAGLELRDGIPDHAFRGLNSDDPRVSQVRDLDMVTGACLLISRSLFDELGGFDTNYINGIEDADLCLQVRYKGYRVVYCPASEVEHCEGVTEGCFEREKGNNQRFVDKWDVHFNAGRLVIPSGVEEELQVDRSFECQANGELQRVNVTKSEMTNRDGPDQVLKKTELTKTGEGITVIFNCEAGKELSVGMLSTPGYNIELRNVHLTGSQGLGEQLEEVRQESSGEFLVFLSTADETQVQIVQKILSHIRREANIGVIVPCLQPQAVCEADALVDVESAMPQCSVVRRAALESIGGFESSFRSLAVLDEVARGCRRHGWRVVCAQDCLLHHETGFPVGDQLLTLRERQAIRSLDEGDHFKDSGDTDAALDSYRKGLAAKDDFVEIIMVLGALLLECGRGFEAKEVIKRLVDIDSESVLGHNYLGLVQYQTKDWEGAKNSFARALLLDPTNVESLVNLGVLEWESGNPEKGIASLEQAATLDPGNRKVIMNIAMLQAKTGNSSSAIRLLRDYTTTDPTDIEVWVLLGSIFFQAGELHHARQIVMKVLEVQPKNLIARAILEKVGGEKEK